MAAKHFSVNFKRSALTVALGVCFAGGVQAQSTVGAVTGHAASGDTITVSNPATGFSRTITVGADGNYRFSQLPVGSYTVTRNGANPRNITVNVGTAANVDYVTAGGATTLDTVTVVGTGAINPIDVSSVESTTILTAEQIAKIPVGRDTTSVALLAPGTVRGDAAFGNLASFGGSSVAENQYYVNGFNITNAFRGLNFSKVPFEAIAEQQIKTGGYGAEFGRSLGGVVNQITKRGTNEFHAGGNIFFAPEDMREEVKNTYLANPLACGSTAPFTACTAGQLREDNSKDSAWNANATVWASGALIKDRLFAYGLVTFARNESETWGNVVSGTNRSAQTDAPGWMLKLDWNISDSHLLEFTAFSDDQETETAVYRNTTGQLNRTSLIGTDFVEQGGDNYILKYTGYLSDSFTLSALYGHGEFSRGRHMLTANGVDVRYGGDLTNPASGCPQIVDSRPGSRRAVTGTYVSTCNITNGSIPRSDSADTRDQFRIDAEWQLGDHLLKFGLDVDNFESIAGESIEGGRRWTYSRTGVSATDPFPDNTDIVTEQITTQGSINEVKQRAFYVQDSWQITDNFMAYLGGRWDTFENLNGFGQTFAKVSNQFGPRLGFSWDVNGDSTFKVFGNAGRYALPLMPTVAVRGASASLFTRQEYLFTGVDPVTGAPLTTGLTPVAGTFRYVNGEDGSPKNPQAITSKGLDPMYQDEYILGFQKTLGDHFSVGVRGIYRDLKAAIDDQCDYIPVMQANGFSQRSDGHWYDTSGRMAAFPGGGFPACRLFNPGSDGVYLTDLYGTGQLTENRIPASLLSPKAKRKYSAFEFFFDGNWDKFFLQGSYTYAKSRGNTEGGVKSDIGQANTGTTQDFDYLALTTDTYGYLPNDRRHSLKLFGNWSITDEWSVGVNYLLQSGRPINCLGLLSPWPFTSSNVHPYGSSFMRCGTTPAGGRAPNPVAIRPRGTSGRLPWTSNFDVNVAYQPSWAEGLQFKVDVFNVLNSQKVTSVVETAEINPTGLPSDTYLLPTSFQAPRSVRLMVQYDF